MLDLRSPEGEKMVKTPTHGPWAHNRCSTNLSVRPSAPQIIVSSPRGVVLSGGSPQRPLTCFLQTCSYVPRLTSITCPSANTCVSRSSSGRFAPKQARVHRSLICLPNSPITQSAVGHCLVSRSEEDICFLRAWGGSSVSTTC